MSVGIAFEGDEKEDGKERRELARSEHLDELLGELPPDSEAEPEPAAAAPEPAKAKAEPEKPREAVVAPEAVEAATEAKPDESEDAEEDPDKKSREGLKRAVAELRAKNRELQSRLQMQTQAPSPARMAEPQAPQRPAEVVDADPDEVAVKIAPDGSRVTVDKDSLRRVAAEIAREEYQRATTPSPEQAAQMEMQRLAMEFVQADPEVHRPVMQQVAEADQFVELALRNGIMTRGHFQSVDEAVEFLRESGVEDQVGQYFPQVGEHFEEFIRSFASKEAGWKRSVLHRIARSARGSSEPAPGSQTPRAELRSVSSTPRSIAQMGGTRAQPESVDEQEFQKLQKEFVDNPFTFPDKAMKRLNALGKKLGKADF